MIGQMITIAAKPVALLLQTTQAYPIQLTPDQQFEIAREALQHGTAPLGILVALAPFVMIIVVVWLVLRRKQALIRSQTELRKQLLDKFASGPELTAFLESKGGQQFLEGIQWQRPGRLRFLPGGLITTLLGLAFLGLTLMGRHFMVPGVILLAVGIGLLISAGVAHKLASAKTGSPNGPSSGNPSSGMQPFPPNN